MDWKSIGANIKNLRQLRGLTQSQVARDLEVSTSAVSGIENGTRKLNVQEMDVLVSLFRCSYEDLLRHKDTLKAPEISPFYRAQAKPTKRMHAILAEFALFCRRYEELEKVTDSEIFSPVRFLPLSSPCASSWKIVDEETNELAVWARQKYFDIGNDPISNIFSLLEDRGTIVARWKFDDCSFDGVALRLPDTSRPAILVNADRGKVLQRQVFSAAHELCHVFADTEKGATLTRTAQEIGSGTRPWYEKRADSFAGKFLIPRADLMFSARKNISTWTTLNFRELSFLCDRYKVSTDALLTTLNGYNWIGSSDRERMLREFGPCQVEISSGSEASLWLSSKAVPHRVTPRFLRLGLEAYLAGLINSGRLGELLREPREKSEELAERYASIFESGDGG